MTKEELKQEAEEWIAKNSKEFITNPNYSPFDYAEAIYIASAEPREKRIAELEKENAEDINTLNKCLEYWKNKSELLEEKLIKAKKYIKKDIDCAIKGSGVVTKEELQEMYDFIKEE